MDKTNTALTPIKSLPHLASLQRQMNDSVLSKFINLNFTTHAVIPTHLQKMLEATEKFDQIYRKLNGNFLSKFEQIIAKQNAIPTHSTLKSFLKIAENQDRIFKQFDGFNKHSEFLQKNGYNNLLFALNNVSSRFIEYTLRHQEWDLAEDFEQITTETLNANEELANSNDLPIQELAAIKLMIESISSKIDSKDNSLKTMMYNWMAIISFLLALLAEARNYLPEERNITPQQLQDFKRDIISEIVNNKAYHSNVKVVERNCKVYKKPNSSASVLAKLFPAYHVVVLQEKHKWLYISFNDCKDNSIKTG